MALENGISAESFWDMAVGDIFEIITAYKRNQAVIIYNQASLISIAVNNPKSFPKSLSIAFPALFSNNAGSKGVDVTDWKLSKANMSAYANNHNKKFKEAGK